MKLTLTHSDGQTSVVKYVVGLTMSTEILIVNHYYRGDEKRVVYSINTDSKHPECNITEFRLETN